jgi:flagellar biosynthesis protein FlhA
MGNIALPGWLRRMQPGGDVTLAIGVGMLLTVLVVPLPTLLLDAGWRFPSPSRCWC